MFKLPRKLFAPLTDGGEGGGDPNPQDTDDVIKFLEPDDDDADIIDLEDKPKKSKEKGTKDEDEEEDDSSDSKTKDKKTSKKDSDDNEDEDDDDDELESLIEEIEEPTEEQLELTTPVRRGEILKKYPNLFKEFPYLEKAYYREQQFTELLPTIDDARKAVNDSKTLERFESDLMSGNINTVLKAVRQDSPNGYYKMIDNLLPTLAEVDEKAYHHLLGNTIKHTIVSMVQEARDSNNETLQAAAQVLNQFVFGSSKFEAPTKLAQDEPKKDEQEDTVSQRERELVRRQFESTRTDLNTRINNSLRATVEANIDPKNSMTDYVKRNAIREVEESVGNLIGQDKRFLKMVDRLWEDAFRKNFHGDSVNRIRSAYLSKAKTLLPAVIKKARNEALRGMGKRVREESETTETKNKSDRPRSKSDSGKTKSKDIPADVTTLDFLMQD